MDKMKTPKEVALEIENEYKKIYSKELNEYRAGKRKNARIKTPELYEYLVPNNSFWKEVVQIYNDRNDNESCWFPGITAPSWMFSIPIGLRTKDNYPLQLSLNNEDWFDGDWDIDITKYMYRRRK